MSAGPPAANLEEPGWREVRGRMRMRKKGVGKVKSSSRRDSDQRKSIPWVGFTTKGSCDVYMLGKKRKEYPMKQKSQR